MWYNIDMIIKTKSGDSILVDDSDGHVLSRHSWHLIDRGRNKYAVAHIDGKRVRMHRLLVDAKPGEVIDHINGNKLDNRRSNLRVCTASQNSCNRGKTVKNRSGFKGVVLNRGRYVVAIRLLGKAYSFCSYKTAEEAAHVYDQVAMQLHGEFAATNFSY